jgi:hypothetical protein
MRDWSEYAFDSINVESEGVAGCPRVAHGVAPMQLSDAVKLLIERWDQLDSGERSSLVEFLLSDLDGIRYEPVSEKETVRGRLRN